MDILIKHTELSDTDAIFVLYNDAIAYQKQVGNNYWLGFETELIHKEIAENRHFTIFCDDMIAGTFCITFADPLIWKDSEFTSAVYIHRIATSQKFRGYKLLTAIISFVKELGRASQLDLIRLDTGAGNNRLINYYIDNGFTFIGNTTVDYTPDLPAHYKDDSFALLQMSV